MTNSNVTTWRDDLTVNEHNRNAGSEWLAAMTKQHVGDEVWRTGPNEMKQDQNKTNKDYRYHVDRFLMNLQDMRTYMQHTHMINA